MAQTIDFSKEDKGVSITVNGQKTSYSANIIFRGYNKGTDIANIAIAPFGSQPISQYTVDTDADTVTVNGGAFTDDAEDLVDSLRDNVFIADVI